MKMSISKLIIGAVAAASLVTGLTVFFTSVAPEAKAALNSVHQSSAKGDRLPILSTGSASSVQAWPNYDRICQFDMRSSTKDAGPSGSSPFGRYKRRPLYLPASKARFETSGAVRGEIRATLTDSNGSKKNETGDYSPYGHLPRPAWRANGAGGLSAR